MRLMTISRSRLGSAERDVPGQAETQDEHRTETVTARKRHSAIDGPFVETKELIRLGKRQ